jgi:hypothetical protein
MPNEHVIPVNERDYHTRDVLCVCAPEVVVGEAGQLIVIHNKFGTS